MIRASIRLRQELVSLLHVLPTRRHTPFVVGVMFSAQANRFFPPEIFLPAP